MNEQKHSVEICFAFPSGCNPSCRARGLSAGSQSTGLGGVSVKSNLLFSSIDVLGPHEGERGLGSFRRSSHPAGKKARGAAPLRGRQRHPDLVTLDPRARAVCAGLLGHVTCFSGSGHARLAHASMGCSRGRTRAPPGKHQGSPGGRNKAHLGAGPGLTWGTRNHLGDQESPGRPGLTWGQEQGSPGGGTRTHLGAGPGLTWGTGLTWGEYKAQMGLETHRATYCLSEGADASLTPSSHTWLPFL